MRSSFFVLLLSLLSRDAWADSTANPLTLRADLQASLSQALCASARALTPQDLWQLGVYDTQMQAAWIDAETPIALSELETAAQQQAQTSLHAGYAFGLCSPHRAWLISTPAPQPIFEKDGETIAIASGALQGSCAQFDLDTANAQQGLPRSLRKKSPIEEQGLRINPAFLEAGTLSVTCHPADKAKRGPELWALMPVGAWDMTAVPSFQPLAANEPLINWVQEIRRAHKLKPLRLDRAVLKNFAQQLVGQGSIRHPRALLLSQAKELKKLKGKFIGENRVKGTAPSEMAWLLWHSPQHRRLLLNKEANAVGFQLARTDADKLLVMVFARL